MSSSTKKKIIVFSSVLLTFIVIFASLSQISKSRTFQVFGQIYSRVETQQKAIALTFDDGPTRERTDEILRILREENVKATFYLTGSEIEKNAGETEKIIAENHEIGNHSYNHDHMVLVTPDFVRNEIETTDDLIRKAGFAGEITFRPPYGKKLFSLPYYLSENNRKTITWDVEPETFVEKSEDIIKYSLENTKNGSIILLHIAYRSREESLKSVSPIIKGLREKGFEFKTVSELLALQD